MVPTWNYVAIHAAGPVTFFDDADKLLAFGHGTHQAPRGAAARALGCNRRACRLHPVDAQGRSSALNLRIEKLEGKWKMSQNRPAEDRPGVVAGLCEEGGAKGAAVAAVVTERNR